MKIQKLCFIFLVLFGSVNAVILCPATNLTYESSSAIPGDVMNYRFSSKGDIYYRIGQ